MSDALSKRIKATDEQIERIEGAISVAEENERRFTKKVYNAMIAGYTSILKDLEKQNSLVYAFSCYMWNMGLVSYLLESLLESRKKSFFILGGPQVGGNARRYIKSHHENVVICNGEGERTFYHFLKELTNFCLR